MIACQTRTAIATEQASLGRHDLAKHGVRMLPSLVIKECPYQISTVCLLLLHIGHNQCRLKASGVDSSAGVPA